MLQLVSKAVIHVTSLKKLEMYSLTLEITELISMIWMHAYNFRRKKKEHIMFISGVNRNSSMSQEYSFNPSSLEAEAGGLLLFGGQPGLPSKFQIS